MSERLAIAAWRDTSSTSLQHWCDALLDGWAPEALGHASVEGLTVSFARADQGSYTRQPDARGLTANVDAFLVLDVVRAHELDDLPARDLLHRDTHRLEVWRVTTHEPKRWDRTWADGETAPGLKMVSLMRRAEGLTHQQFVRHWTERHAPLALEHHVGLWNYRQHSVRRALTPGGEEIDGIAELHFRTDDDFATRFFDSDDGRRVILDDVATFMARPGPETALMTELPLRTV